MAHNNIGSKRLVVGAGYGMGDWLAQRITAVVVGLFTLVVLVLALTAGEASYDSWGGVFAPMWMKILTFVALVALFYHAWVGVRNVWMDYVKPLALRVALQVLTVAWLVGCAGYALNILWRI